MTPNFVHFDPAMKLVKAGIPVFCEKPLTITAKETEQLAKARREDKVPFGVAHTYLGHWTSRFARSSSLGQARRGALGRCLLPPGLARHALEDSGQQQASWRVDPKRAGASCCGGDIGTHAFMQLRFVTGLEVTSVRGMIETSSRAASSTTTSPPTVELSQRRQGAGPRQPDRHRPQERPRHRGGVRERQPGWRQEDPERVTLHLPAASDGSTGAGRCRRTTTSSGRCPADLLAEPTIPSGHAEAFHDAFARLHRFFEEDVRAYNDEKPFTCDGSRYANVHDGVKHMRFVEAAVKSAKANSKPVARREHDTEVKGPARAGPALRAPALPCHTPSDRVDDLDVGAVGHRRLVVRAARDELAVDPHRQHAAHVVLLLRMSATVIPSSYSSGSSFTRACGRSSASAASARRPPHPSGKSIPSFFSVSSVGMPSGVQPRRL